MNTYNKLRNATLANRLRNARVHKNITRHQLAVKSDVKYTTIRNIENQISVQPRGIMKLARALEINPAWLQYGNGYADRERPEGM